MADASGSARIVLLGPPGSGKGTQAAILAEKLSVPAVATGDMLRAAVAAGEELGARVETVMAAGELVDNGLMGQLVRERLGRADAEKGFLLDGYPRTPSQAATLEKILAGRDQALDHVILIEVPEEVLIERAVARGRGEDDREEVVRERQRVYREKTAPLVAHYRELGLLREVNGDRTVEEVANALEQIVC